MIEPLRIVGFLCWATLLGVLAPRVYRTLFTRHGNADDAILTIVFGLAVNRVGFIAVAQFAPNSDALLAICYITAAGLALTMAAAAWRK